MNLRKKIINEFGGLSPELQRAAEFSLQNASQAGGGALPRASAAEAGKTGDAAASGAATGLPRLERAESDFIDDLAAQ